MTELTRRAALVGAAGAGAVALAGCVSNDDPDSEAADNPTDDDTNTESSTDELSLTASVERVGSSCAMSDSGEATVFLDDDEFVISGELPAPTPCYDPELTAHSFADGTLSVTVDVVAQSDEACADCRGSVYYEARLSGPSPDDVEQVSVSHANGQSYEVPAADIDQGPPAVRGATLTETTSESRGSGARGRAEVTLPESETGAVTIDGAIPTEHPHYEAVMKEATVHGTTLRVAVGVESTREEGTMGTMPLGIVEYTASVDVEHPDGLDSVTVEHPNGSYGSSWASSSATAEGASGSRAGDSTESDGSS